MCCFPYRNGTFPVQLPIISLTPENWHLDVLKSRLLNGHYCLLYVFDFGFTFAMVMANIIQMNIFHKTLVVNLLKAISLTLLLFDAHGSFAQFNVGSGNSIQLNPAGSEYVSLGASMNSLSLPLTLTAWVKPNSVNGINPLFSSCSDPSDWHGFWIHTNNSQISVGFGDGDGGFTNASKRVFKAPLNSSITGGWVHVAAVITGPNDIEVYLNGNKLSGNYSGNATQMANNANGSADIGYHLRSSATTYNGEIDELAVYDVALTVTQIRNLMCRKINAANTNIIGAWDFNDVQSSNTIADISGNGLTGNKNGNVGHVRSSAPVGDRSFSTYNATVVNGYSLTGDTASATVQGNGAPGIHLYFVDQKPIPQPQVTSGGMPSAANFYVGVFAADYNRNYGFTLAPNPNTYQPNTLGLAHRPHNAATSWAGLTALNNPVISINSRPAPEQLALVDRCPTPNLLPDTARCDSVRLVVTGPYDQFIWSNNDTGNTRWVTQSGKVWVQARDTTNGCTVADTAQVNIIDPATTSLFPDDTLVCNSDFIELSATLPGVLSYQWSNGQTDSIARFFNPDTFWLKLFLPGGCTVADTIVVNFSEDIEPMVIERRTLCAGEEITVDIDPLEFVRVTWSTGSTDFSETFNTPGTYGVAAEKPDGCIEYDSLYLLPPPGTDSAQVYSDTTFCAADGGIRLLPPDSFNVRWPNNSDSLFIVNQTQVVRAEISDSCTNWVEFFSVNKVDCGCQVKIPNAFTPNGDGLNEVFRPIGTCEYTDYNLVIFNRWGIKIFETNEIGAGFDGKLNEEVLPQGAYMYRFTYETESVENRLTGSFQLLR